MINELLRNVDSYLQATRQILLELYEYIVCELEKNPITLHDSTNTQLKGE